VLSTDRVFGRYGLAARSHLLEAKARRAILEQLLSQRTEVVDARETLDLAEDFAWVTNPPEPHGRSTKALAGFLSRLHSVSAGKAGPRPRKVSWARLTH
jgi:hypothetical protein